MGYFKILGQFVDLNNNCYIQYFLVTPIISIIGYKKFEIVETDTFIKRTLDI